VGKSRFWTKTIYHPAYGPHGEPFGVRRDLNGQDELVEWVWTEEEAWCRRGEWMLAGHTGVRILGLPEIIAGCG
jgi:hypothetical protein